MRFEHTSRHGNENTLTVYHDDVYLNFIYKDKSQLVFTCINNNLNLEIYIIVIPYFHFRRE